MICIDPTTPQKNLSEDKNGRQEKGIQGDV